MRLIEFSIKQRVLVNILMIGLFIAGVICMLNLRREIFPSISTDVITITTLDVTLDSPEDVERLVTVPIEDQLRAIEDVKEIHSVSSPNLSVIFLKLYDNVSDIQVVLNEVRQEVDSAKRDLPKTSESPITIEQKFPFPVIIVGMSYRPGMNLLKIKKVADRLQTQFESIQGVSEVDVRGLSDREIWVEVDPYRARALNISLESINKAISAKNKNIPGGIIKGNTGEMTIRVLEQINEDTWRDLENIVIKNSKNEIIRLRDVATIRNTFEEATTLSRVNGRPAITFIVNKRKTGDTIAIDEKVREYIDEAKVLLPAGVNLSFYSDSAKFVKKRMSTMIRNGIISMVLVAIMLLLFMNWRISMIVVAGLLVSFFGAFIYLKLVNNSFNMISLFSLILVLGMLVDDAIVVCENVYRHMEDGKSPYDAAIIGTKEV
ncbi:efflux RND transporter permease subunit, partial [bacterium]|nr:efflux RND transporter permease subunit [bacterium]